MVPEFVVEFYASRTDARAVAGHADRARASGEELARQGTPVRYVRSLFVPDDETCFFLFEAQSAAAVQQAALDADLPFERVVEVMPEL